MRNKEAHWIVADFIVIYPFVFATMPARLAPNQPPSHMCDEVAAERGLYRCYVQTHLA